MRAVMSAGGIVVKEKNGDETDGRIGNVISIMEDESSSLAVELDGANT
jgi:hypothetical protein